MAFENCEEITLTSGAAVSQNRFVLLSSGLAIHATLGAESIGVSQEAATASGEAISVIGNQSAKVEVEAGAAVALGANVSSDATGRGITSAIGHVILGVALEAAGAAGERITVLLNKAITPSA